MTTRSQFVLCTLAALVLALLVYPVTAGSFGAESRYLIVEHAVEKDGHTIYPFTVRGVVFYDPAFLRKSSASATASTNGAASMYVHSDQGAVKLIDTLHKVDELSKTHERLAGPDNLRVSKDSVQLLKQIRRLLQDSQPTSKEVRNFVLQLSNATDIASILGVQDSYIGPHFDNVLWALDHSHVYKVRILVKDVGSILQNTKVTVEDLEPVLRDAPVSQTFEASVPLCLYASSGFRDRLGLILDAENDLWHVNYGVEASKCAKRNAQHRRLSSKAIVELTTPQFGSRPVLNKETMRAARLAASNPAQGVNTDGTPVTDDRGFLAKYWMYLLPVALLMVMSTTTEEPAAAPKK